MYLKKILYGRDIFNASFFFEPLGTQTGRHYFDFIRLLAKKKKSGRIWWRGSEKPGVSWDRRPFVTGVGNQYLARAKAVPKSTSASR